MAGTSDSDRPEGTAATGDAPESAGAPVPALGARSRDIGLGTRPITDSDQEFLAELYASTRREEVAQTGWSPEEQEAFLRQQFDAQHRHYQQYYADARFLVLERFGAPIGRLYLQTRERERDVRLVDIALMPSARGQGVGQRILEDLLEAAGARGLAVSIHVEVNNPAMSLYRRLGFREIDENGVYRLMEWRAEPGSAATSD